VPLYIKKYYHDDPIFTWAKVVYSVYNDDFPGALNKNFRKKLLLKGITGNDVKILENPTFINVSKLAIYFSDAIIKGTSEVNPEIEKYILEMGKKLLPHQSRETYIDVYNEFYNEM
jgi:starch synthase